MHPPLVLQQVIMTYKTVSAFAVTVHDVTREELLLGRREVCFQMAFQVCFASEGFFAGIHSTEVLCLGVN
jgi:hypothetical protein